MGSTTIHTVRYRRLSALLRTWREKAGMTQRELGEKLRKPHSYVHKCEVAERKLDPFELLEWLEACEIDVQQAIRTIQGMRHS
jgi:hypothetical protein